jgi:hypothetical protein
MTPGHGTAPALRGGAWKESPGAPALRGGTWIRALGLAVLVACLHTALPARAQGTQSEAADPTRLDVERLPPEALAVTRDMFARGFFLQGLIGGRGFAGGLGRISLPGAFGRVGAGYEFFDWLAIGTAVELSLHDTSAPPPPAPGTFELVDVLVELRLQLPLSARAALWLGGETGLGWTSGNLLVAYGLHDAGDPGVFYGGSLGFDWHLLNRHYSLGLIAGARMYPSLAGLNGETTIGIHSAAYLQYVF